MSYAPKFSPIVSGQSYPDAWQLTSEWSSSVARFLFLNPSLLISNYSAFVRRFYRAVNQFDHPQYRLYPTERHVPCGTFRPVSFHSDLSTSLPFRVLSADYLSTNPPLPLTLMGPFLLALCFFVPFAFAMLIRWMRPPSLPLPPGPKGYPFIGNLLQAPVNLPWKVFHEWSKIYGLSLLRIMRPLLTTPRLRNVSLDTKPAAGHFGYS